MKSELKQMHINALRNEYGESFFNLNQFAVPLGVRTTLCDMAKEVGYKKPQNDSSSLGMAYFHHLQKIANK